MFDLTNIDQLLSGAYHRDRTDYQFTASTEYSNCHNYTLSGSSECGSLPAVSLYLEIVAFNPIEYVNEIKGENDGTGTFQKTWHKKDAIISFPAILNESLVNKIELISMHENIKFADLVNGGAPIEIRELEIRINEVDDIIRAEISFKVSGAAKIVQACCGSFYEDAPYDECDGTGSSDPNLDPECISYAVTISLTGGSLVASSSGGPVSGTELFTWYLDGVLIGTGTSINPNQAGVYQVIATKGNCQTSDEYVYQDCSTFEVTIDYLILADGTTILIASANRNSTFQWQQDTGSGWVDMAGEVNAWVVPDADGDYRVIATTADNCQDTSNELPVVVPVNCETLFDLAVTRDDDVLTAVIANYLGAGTPAFQWWKDTGDGNGLTVMAGETGQTLTVTERGYFLVETTLDGCTKEAWYIILDDCILFRAYIETIAEQAPTFARLTAATINAPDTVVHDWYIWAGDKWTKVFTGNPFDLETAAVVRLVTTSGLCTKEDITTFCVDPDSIIPYQKFIGTGDDLVAELYSECTVTANGLIVGNPATMTPNEMNAKYLVFRNGVKLSYAAPADIQSGGSLQFDRQRYSFDYADNQILLPFGWHLDLGEILEIQQLF